MAQIVSQGDVDSPFGFVDLGDLCRAILDRDSNGVSSCNERWVSAVVAHLHDVDQISFLTDGEDPHTGLGGPPWIEEVADSDGTVVQRLAVFSFQSLLPDCGREIGLNDELRDSLDGHWEWGNGLNDNLAARAFFPLLVSAVACAVVEYLSTVGEVKTDLGPDPDARDEKGARHLLNGRCIEAVEKKGSTIARDALVSFISELRVADETG